jgi:DNA-binding MarR family transcriptional regulator
VTGPPTPKKIADPAVLKAFSHPLRRGPATATTLAAELGVNTGTTSYHLRELTKHGFVEENPGTGHGRERWWRARRRDLRFPRRSQQSEQMRVLFDEFNRHHFDEDLALLKRYWRADDAIPPDARRLIVRFIAFPDPRIEQRDLGRRAATRRPR